MEDLLLKFNHITQSHPDIADYEKFYSNAVKYLKLNKSAHRRIFRVLLICLETFENKTLLSIVYRLLDIFDIKYKIPKRILKKHFGHKTLRNSMFNIINKMNTKIFDKTLYRLLYDPHYESPQFFNFLINRREWVEQFLEIEDCNYLRKQALILSHTRIYHNIEYFIDYIGDKDKSICFLIYECLKLFVVDLQANLLLPINPTQQFSDGAEKCSDKQEHRKATGQLFDTTNESISNEQCLISNRDGIEIHQDIDIDVSYAQEYQKDKKHPVGKSIQVDTGKLNRVNENTYQQQVTYLDLMQEQHTYGPYALSQTTNLNNTEGNLGMNNRETLQSIFPGCKNQNEHTEDSDATKPYSETVNIRQYDQNTATCPEMQEKVLYKGNKFSVIWRMGKSYIHFNRNLSIGSSYNFLIFAFEFLEESEVIRSLVSERKLKEILVILQKYISNLELLDLPPSRYFIKRNKPVRGLFLPGENEEENFEYLFSGHSDAPGIANPRLLQLFPTTEGLMKIAQGRSQNLMGDIGCVVMRALTRSIVEVFLPDRMSTQEACQILNVTKYTPFDEVESHYHNFYNANTPSLGGSSYIQSKIADAFKLLQQKRGFL